MELTPEERQRIYEEEKARLEAQQWLKAESMARGARQVPESKRMGNRWLVGYLIMAGVMLWVALIVIAREPQRSGSVEQRPAKPARPTTSAVDSAQQARDVEALLATGVVTRIDGKGSPPRVFVGRSFYALDYQERESAAKRVSDYWATLQGATGGGALFDICDAYSGERLYTWEYYKLKKR